MMVHKHLYSGMSHFDNNLLSFHNEFLPNQVHKNRQMLFCLFHYIYLQKESFITLWKEKYIPLFQQVFGLQGRLSTWHSLPSKPDGHIQE